MLKLNASYSKKVPAEGEYTSQSYHASIEVELPDGLNSEQLNGKIHETFALVRNSVEAELHGATPAVTVTTTSAAPRKAAILATTTTVAKATAATMLRQAPSRSSSCWILPATAVSPLNRSKPGSEWRCWRL